MKIELELGKLANPQNAKVLRSFFKTGKGQYGEGDVFLGVTVPESRKVAKQFSQLPLDEVKVLLNSKVHEARLVALLILVQRFQAAEKEHNEVEQKRIFDFYLDNVHRVNNWDLVDLTAPNIVGKHLLHSDYSVLLKLAKSESLWKRRVAIVSTLAFIRNNNFQPTFEITKLLLSDKHDLIHKACGWMLREVGKRKQFALEKFLKRYCNAMPRTMLRYAIECFPEEKRLSYLHS